MKNKLITYTKEQVIDILQELYFRNDILNNQGRNIYIKLNGILYDFYYCNGVSHCYIYNLNGKLLMKFLITSPILRDRINKNWDKHNLGGKDEEISKRKI